MVSFSITLHKEHVYPVLTSWPRIFDIANGNANDIANDNADDIANGNQIKHLDLLDTIKDVKTAIWELTETMTMVLSSLEDLCTTNILLGTIFIKSDYWFNTNTGLIF